MYCVNRRDGFSLQGLAEGFHDSVFTQGRCSVRVRRNHTIDRKRQGGRFGIGAFDHKMKLSGRSNAILTGRDECQTDALCNVVTLGHHDTMERRRDRGNEPVVDVAEVDRRRR